MAGSTIYSGRFTDSVTYDPEQRSALTACDGVLYYSGSELGMEPVDKNFSVYRSPATISNAAMRMRGIPLTPEHVPLDAPAPSDGGFVADANMVDVHEADTHTTIAVRGMLTLSDAMRQLVESGRREMSLGYNADLVPHDVYDFEQKDIQPHHLATVDEGRCGPMCTFLDAKPPTDDDDTTSEDDDMSGKTKLHKAFTDQDGSMNLQQVVEMATALPDAIREVPVDQLSELMAPIQAIMEAAKGRGVEAEDAGNGDEPKPDDGNGDTPAPMEDGKVFADAVNKKVQAQLADAVKRHTAVVEKARNFLPADYAFADKSTEQVMRDAVATKRNERFEDGELSIAFKMLETPTTDSAQTGPGRYADFADRASGSDKLDFSGIADRDIGEAAG